MTSLKQNFKTTYRSPLASIISYNGTVPNLHPSVFLADGARVVGNTCMGANSSVWFNAVVRGDANQINIGSETNVQDAAVIHATFQKNPTTIGCRVSIGHMAVIHGCTIEDNCLIGIGAVVLDGAVVGEGSIIGAQALITRGMVIPKRSLVLGSPGKVIRSISVEEYEAMLATTLRYVEYAKGFKIPPQSSG